MTAVKFEQYNVKGIGRIAQYDYKILITIGKNCCFEVKKEKDQKFSRIY